VSTQRHADCLGMTFILGKALQRFLTSTLFYYCHQCLFLVQ
jgi:hypothetical protein